MEFLYVIPTWQIALVFFSLLSLSIQAGNAFGRRLRYSKNDAPDKTFRTLIGEALGLLALLLAFSFSIAASRDDARKHAIVEEANAIGTSYLRASLLGDASKTQMITLLRAYVDTRQAQYDAGIDPKQAEKIDTATEHLQTKLWELVSTEARSAPNVLIVTQVVQSVNDVVDTCAATNAALRNRVPEVILLMLLTTALVAGLLVGYALGTSGERNRFATLMFAVTTSIVILTLLDLDRPRRGLIVLSQSPMADLRESIAPDQ
jgi:hypothetical protein